MKLIDYNGIKKIVEKIKAKIDGLNRTVTDNFGTLQGSINAINKNKVDKVNGKGLSTNDFTNDMKTSLVDNFAGVVEFNGDLNTLFKAGMYSVQSPTNRPTDDSKYGTCIVTKADRSLGSGTTDSIQIWISRHNEMWIRNSIDKTNAWTPWVKVGSPNVETVKVNDVVYLVKYGNVVTVYFINMDRGVINRTKIPVGFRPNCGIVDAFKLEVDFARDSDGIVSVASDGNCHVSGAVNSSTIDVCLTYVVK